MVSMFGKHHSMETKEKIRDTLKGNVPWNKSVKWSMESKRKMSECKKGEKHPIFGKCHTIETKKKMSDARKKY